MNGMIYFRADHELIGRVLAEKLRRKTERTDFADDLRVTGGHARPVRRVGRA